MSYKPYLLSIDNGTQSVRALVFDLQGNLIHKVHIPIEPYYSTHPGWAEQDPQIFWQSVCDACQGIWQDSDITPDQIAGVAVTTQRATVINLDSAGNPLRDAISWLDQRRSENYPDVGRLWKLIFKMVGQSGTVKYFQSKASNNWIAYNQTQVWEKTHKYLLLSGYLNYKITGEFTDSAASQVGYLPFNYKDLTWSSDRDWKWKALHIDRDKLPELVNPGEKIGEIRDQAAGETGLLSGTPVIAAAADKACEVLGTGTTGLHQACLGYGTTATVNVTSSKYTEPTPFIPPYPAAIPNNYSIEVQNFRGFWLVSWFKKEFGHREQDIAPQEGLTPEELLNRMLDQVPAGSVGLMTLPYWTPGVRIPGPEAKGSIIGFADLHTRAHIYRAILEGLAYALREGSERIQKRTKQKITSLAVAGGGSQSDRVMQITADIFGLPASRPHVYETSGLGAAIDCAVGLGLHSDFDTAIREMTRSTAVFEPNPDTHDFYNQLYTRVYKHMYKQLKPLYQEIQDITGYP